MMITTWFSKDPPEMPYNWTAPAGSLTLGFIMLIYNTVKFKKQQVPGTVLAVNVVWLFVTGILLVLALIYPEKQCCCPGGVKANKVDMGSCENKEPSAALVVDGAQEEDP